MKHSIKDCIVYIREFGTYIFLLSALIGFLGKLKMWKLQHFIEDIKQERILRFLEKDIVVSEIMSNVLSSCNEQKECNIIWIFWYQGITDAPPIVKACIESIKKNSANYQVVILDNTNLEDYYRPSPEIIKKVEKGIISLTQFSDIIRMNLLHMYGGRWIDATIYLTGTVFKDNEFFTIKSSLDAWRVSRGQWTGFFMGGENPQLYMFCKLFFEQYWKKHNILVTYFLIDYAIRLAYNLNSTVRERIDSVDQYPKDIYYLQANLNNHIGQSDYYSFISKSKIHKLSYKIDFNHDSDSVYNSYIIGGEK